MTFYKVLDVIQIFLLVGEYKESREIIQVKLKVLGPFVGSLDLGNFIFFIEIHAVAREPFFAKPKAITIIKEL